MLALECHCNSIWPECFQAYIFILLTSSPFSYGSKIPWSQWCLPCRPCTGHTAPRCTGCTPAPPPATPHLRPPPSQRPAVRPACHKACSSLFLPVTHMSLRVGGHGGLSCRPAYICVCGRCVRGDGRRRTELRTGVRRGARTVPKLYLH